MVESQVMGHGQLIIDAKTEEQHKTGSTDWRIEVSPVRTGMRTNVMCAMSDDIQFAYLFVHTHTHITHAMYVHNFFCIYICVNTRTYTYTHKHTHSRMSACIRAHAQVHTYATKIKN